VTAEGRAPAPGDGPDVADVVDQAFDYRGDVTLDTADGREVVGYLFNRDREVAEPFVQLFERDSGARLTLPYASIRAIRFTGKDTAAGNSYAAWRQRREAASSGSAPDA
jgi:hypothetical protein